ncbi:MAG TPA: PIG-L deacetylase family protein [Bryobacteraceae bacterium]|nr:PIG-L deacetylase family protein [Bryobacteraceae bacterium]
MRIICIGAHPDDCEIGFGGCAAMLTEAGHAVKFLSVTNGDAGHHVLDREALAGIRSAEAQEAARRLAIAESEILGNHDGELLHTLELRQEIIRQIRAWGADVVLTPRPWDYHPDHRYTAQLVQDAAYLAIVPHICAGTPALARNPVFLYLEDSFQMPVPFAPDIAVDIEDAWDRKLDALEAHRSQFYEWLPWVEGSLEQVPEEGPRRRDWLGERIARELSPCTRAALARRYGRTRQVKHAESFQVCEYGRRPASGELDEIFPR